MTAQLPSRERLEALASGNAFTCVQDDEATAMARALLAAHEQEPVAYMCDGDDGREYNGHNEFSCGGRGIPLYTHPAPVPAVPDDTRRMDWLVSKTVNVREPMVYGSHDLFWSQTISDDWDEEHKTTLREQIDAAMAAAPKVKP